MRILRISNPFFSQLTTVAEPACEEVKLGSAAGALPRQQLPQHERQNAAVPVIIDFERCTNPLNQLIDPIATTLTQSGIELCAYLLSRSLCPSRLQ
jgi:hypothetical protein